VIQVDRRGVLRAFGAAATLGVTGALAACGKDPAKSVTTVRLGLLAPKSGPYTSIGVDIYAGFKQYLDSHDNILGGKYPVEVVVANEGTTVDVAREATKSLLSQQVHAIVGVANPAALSGIRDLVEKAKTPLISANGSPADLTSVYYMWRASYVDGQASTALANYLVEEGRYRRAYVLRDGSAQAQAEVDAFRKSFLGGPRTIVDEVRVAGAYANRLVAAGNSGADLLYAALSGDAGWRLVQAYASSSVALPLVGPGTLTESRDVVKLAGQMKDLRPVLTTMNYAANLGNAANKAFAARYSRVTGAEPTTYAVAAYDAAAIVDQALRLMSGDITPLELNRAIASVGEIDSPRGPWAFTTTRTPQQQWYLRKLALSGQVPANMVAKDLATLT
jgi:branched-chain amino acid transport system substrate-binding protein